MKVLIVDDDRLVCASLKTILEADNGITVIGPGHSGKEAISLFEIHSPDILLMDIRMENISGLEAGELILKNHPGAKLLFLTTFADNDYIIKALKIRASGYILKQNFESIIPSLKAVYSGQKVFGDEIVTRLPELLGKEKKPDPADFGINEKEAEIISLVAGGLNNREIAAKLYLSEGTVRNYLSIILEKLQLRDRTQLAIFYFKNLE